MNKILLLGLMVPNMLLSGGIEKLHAAVLKNDFEEVNSITSKHNRPFFNLDREADYKEIITSITITNCQNKNTCLSKFGNRCFQFSAGLFVAALGFGCEALLLTSDEYTEKGTHLLTIINTIAFGGGLQCMYNALTNKKNLQEYANAIAISKLLSDCHFISPNLEAEEDE